MNYYEDCSTKKHDNNCFDGMELKTLCDGYSVSNPHWRCKDEIFDRTGKCIDIIESHNLMVADVSKLIAGLIGLKFSKGIQYWAIGSGNPTWDAQWNTASPPAPVKTATKLINEFYRHPIQASDITFVDATDNALPDTTYSNKIKITINVDFSQGNGDWREFGLIGGVGTTTKDTGLMLDHKYHKIISKTSEISVKRSIILEF